MRAFWAYLPGGKQVDKPLVLAYKTHLAEGYAPASVSSMLAALNTFFAYAGWHECRVKPLKLQRAAFCAPERELTRAEYLRLLDAARRRRDEGIVLLMETIGATGIRVSELQYITVEAAHLGRAAVNCKGKRRAVLLPSKLVGKLLKYARHRESTPGASSAPAAARRSTAPVCGR